MVLQSRDVHWLEVVVERVLPFGVFVRLPDGRKGYIRRRELDLDADINPAEVLQEGQKIQAIRLNPAIENTNIELSRRATLKDPWLEFSQRFHDGDTVHGTVRALHPTGAFVRIQAGISGWVPLDEVATWQVDQPEDVLWVGDTVEMTIIRLDPNDKQLTLSIKARMTYRDGLKTTDISSAQPVRQPTAIVREKSDRLIAPEMRDRAGAILVVDDHDEVRTSLATWLRSRGFTAFEADSFGTALTSVQTNDCHILLVDLNLVERDGLELIRYLRDNGNQAHICVMSGLDSLTERAEEIEAAQVTQVFPKPLDLEDMEEFLMSLAKGTSAPLWRAGPRLIPPSNDAKRSESNVVSLQRGLQSTLDQITEQIRAEVGLIFRLDSTSRAISIVVQAGDIPIRLEAIYSLSASPVNDVMRDSESLLENHVTANFKAKYHKLLDLLSFESCIGVPIKVNDETQYAAFFFHREPDSFSAYRLRDAQAGALLLSALLTREILEKQLQSLNPMLLSGELARGFGHDVFNKITALDIEISILTSRQVALAEMQIGVRHLLDLIHDLKDTVRVFQEILQTKESQDNFDVNRVVERANELLRPIALKERAKIELNLAPNLPSLRGNSIILQQVFLNIMLNAIQQMSFKAAKFRWSGKRILRATTSFNEKAQYIRIRFVDNGPGIHRAHLKKIFSPGFSTRGGSGLGLYIAGSFIESFGGKLRVQETLVPLGTTFLVEVPIGTQEVAP